MRVFDATDRADDNVDGLIELCKDWITKDMVMAEIGCYRGVSTSIFSKYAKIVHAVDAWMDNFANYHELPRDMLESAEPLFDKVLEKYPNIVKHKGLSVDVAKHFDDESLDAIYIDGDHSESAFNLDCTSWIPKVKKGGVIAGHDHCIVGAWIPGQTVRVYPDESWAYAKP